MKSKRGVTTLFLSIILTALILIETTYIAYVADLDRRLTLTRALKSQGEVYLVQYNRELFNTYGIYALDSTYLDDSVFNDILSANGYEVGQTMFVSGIYDFDTEDLRRAVATFYTYRTSGIVFDRLSNQIFSLLRSIDEYGILDYLSQFMSSDASNALSQIIEGGVNVVGDVTELLSDFGIDINSVGYQMLVNLITSLKQITYSNLDPASSFNPSDMGVITSSLQTVIEINNSVSNFIDDYMIHPYLVDYASYNFDTRLNDDTSINGSEFTIFHSDNLSDTEYILTGFEGDLGNSITYTSILGILLVENIVSILLDNAKREVVIGASEVLSALIATLTGGAVPLPPIVYEIVIIVIWAIVESVSDINTLLSGESITFVEYNGIDILTLGYRDFISFLMFCVPDSVLLERITSVINRDFPNYITGLSLQTEYGMRTLHYEVTYGLYS